MVTTIATVNILMMRSIRESSGLGTAEFRLLGVLVRQSEGIRPKDLGGVLGLSVPVVSSTVSRLVSSGYALKLPVSHDARGQLVTSTSRGRDAFETANRALAALVGELWQGMPEELRNLSFQGTARVDDMEKGALARRRAGAKFITLFFETYHISHGHIERTLGSFDLSVSEYRLLRLVVEGGGCTMGEAAQTLFLAPNRTCVAADALVQRGLLRRERVAVDRRSFTLAPTEAGASRLADATEALAYSMRHIPYAVTEHEGLEFERQAKHISKRLAAITARTGDLG